MKAKDDHRWSQQLDELNVDDMGRKFAEFLVFWVETADTMLADSGPDSEPYIQLSKAFEVAEQTHGFLSVEWLGQMLLVIVEHWFHGDRLWESLSVWERRMVEQATALKIAEMQKIAAEPAETP